MDGVEPCMGACIRGKTDEMMSDVAVLTVPHCSKRFLDSRSVVIFGVIVNILRLACVGHRRSVTCQGRCSLRRGPAGRGCACHTL